MTVRIAATRPPEQRLRVKATWEAEGRVQSYELRLPDGTVLVVGADELDRDLNRARDKAHEEWKAYRRRSLA